MNISEPSVNILHYPCCMCDMEEDIEFDTPIVLKLKIYKPGTVKVKVNGDKKFSVEGGNGVFDVEIIENIVADRLADIDKAKKAQQTRERNRRIAEIIADKEDAALHEMSLEDLKAMLTSDDNE